MKHDKQVARFAINTSLDALQDIYDLEDAVDTIVSGLMEADEVPPDVWLGLKMMRERLDILRNRATFVPMIVREVVEESHSNKSQPVD